MLPYGLPHFKISGLLIVLYYLWTATGTKRLPIVTPWTEVEGSRSDCHSDDLRGVVEPDCTGDML